MSSIYLGAAIDLASSLNAFDEMNKIILDSERFKKSLIFRPDTAWSNARNIAENETAINYLMQVNDFALINADLAVFFVSKNVFSAGVAHEIEKRLSVPRVTYIIAEKLGFYTMGQMNNANRKHTFSRVYKTLEEFKNTFEEDFARDNKNFQDWKHYNVEHLRAAGVMI